MNGSAADYPNDDSMLRNLWRYPNFGLFLWNALAVWLQKSLNSETDACIINSLFQIFVNSACILSEFFVFYYLQEVHNTLSRPLIFSVLSMLRLINHSAVEKCFLGRLHWNLSKNVISACGGSTWTPISCHNKTLKGVLRNIVHRISNAIPRSWLNLFVAFIISAERFMVYINKVRLWS